MDKVMIAAMGLMVLIGFLMIVFPDQCLRADKRGDTELAAKVRKCGFGIIGLMAVVALLSLKYTLL
jgi:hypothetical protein